MHRKSGSKPPVRQARRSLALMHAPPCHNKTAADPPSRSRAPRLFRIGARLGRGFSAVDGIRVGADALACGGTEPKRACASGFDAALVRSTCQKTQNVRREAIDRRSRRLQQSFQFHSVVRNAIHQTTDLAIRSTRRRREEFRRDFACERRLSQLHTKYMRAQVQLSAEAI